MLWTKIVKDYLTFGKRDRIGALLLLAVVAGGLALPRLLAPEQTATPVQENDALAKAIDTLKNRQAVAANNRYERFDNNPSNYRYETSSQRPAFTAGELFSFDPNTATAADWQRMGLNERTSKTIEKYVSKGGKFYRAEDLMKIWGMPEGFYDRVKSYATFESVKRNYASSNYEDRTFVREERKPTVVSINGADTSAFIALPGIGSKLSARIIAFREKLGGFHSVEQVGETYGLPDSTFQKIKSRLQVDGEVRKLNVNTATKDALKVHPYIRWNLANAIVEYRAQHGSFKDLEALKNIALVDEATFEKIRHYLKVE